MLTAKVVAAGCLAVALSVALRFSARAPAATVRVDGSSTIFLISEAVAEEFGREKGAPRTTVGVSGTGGGFKKLCGGEIDINGASRPIRADEKAMCEKSHVEYVEIPIAYDGVAVVVNPANTWAVAMTVPELRRLWEPASQGRVSRWSQIREGWPDKPIHLFGPGLDSGTYDYFTEAIVGTQHSSRADYSASEDHNTLVRGVVSDPCALAFVGLGYYEANRAELRAVAIDDGDPANGDGPIAPSRRTVHDGTYQPLSRPLLLYVANASLVRSKPVRDFVDFYLTRGSKLVPDVGYIPLPARAYEQAESRIAQRKVGSVFDGNGSTVGVSIETLLSKE